MTFEPVDCPVCFISGTPLKRPILKDVYIRTNTNYVKIFVDIAHETGAF